MRGQDNKHMDNEGESVEITEECLLSLLDVPEAQRPCRDGLRYAIEWVRAQGGSVRLTSGVLRGAIDYGLDVQWWLARAELPAETVAALAGDADVGVQIALRSRKGAPAE